MTASQITSIGWLYHTQGIQLVACTADCSHGHRKIVSASAFEKARHSDEALKALFISSAPSVPSV